MIVENAFATERVEGMSVLRCDDRRRDPCEDACEGRDACGRDPCVE
jgi:hypothetical protein